MGRGGHPASIEAMSISVILRMRASADTGNLWGIDGYRVVEWRIAVDTRQFDRLARLAGSRRRARRSDCRHRAAGDARGGIGKEAQEAVQAESGAVPLQERRGLPGRGELRQALLRPPIRFGLPERVPLRLREGQLGLHDQHQLARRMPDAELLRRRRQVPEGDALPARRRLRRGPLRSRLPGLIPSRGPGRG